MENTELLQIIKSICPHSLNIYLDAFKCHSYYLKDYGISDSKLNLSHFLCQIMHETMNFQKEEENLNYRAQRLVEVFPSRFKPRGPNDPFKFEKNPKKLANVIYGGRYGNNLENDGWAYRGRGFANLTFKSMYSSISDGLSKRYGKETPDFVSFPGYVLDPKWSLGVACEFWRIKGCSALALKDDIIGVTKLFNGGSNGLKERKNLLSIIKKKVGI